MKKIILILCFNQFAFGAAAPENSDLQEQFVKEIVAGDLEAVKKSVAAGANINSLDWQNCSPLARAIVHNHVHVAQFLISKGADKNFVHVNGFSLLHLATINNATESIKFLASLGFDLNEEDKSKNYSTPLELAIGEHKNNAALILIEIGAKWDEKNRLGGTPLACALCNKNYVMFMKLIDLGANINTVTSHGNTLLHLAADRGVIFAIKFLLDKGLNIEAIGQRNLTPLAMATGGNHVNAIKILIARGANINYKHPEGNNLLHLAIANKAINSLRFFIEAGFDVEALGFKGLHPLFHAITEDFSDGIDCLILHKSNVNFRTPRGDDLVNFAVRTQCNKALRALLNNGVNPDKKDVDGQTPLHNATNNTEQVRLILDAYADYKIKDNYDCTPDFYAEPAVAQLYTSEQARRQNEKEVLIKSKSELLDHGLPAEVVDIVQDYMLAKPIRKKALT